MSSVYIHLLRKEIDKQGCMNDKIDEYLTVLEENTHLVAYKKGETPEHLKEYLYEKKEE